LTHVSPAHRLSLGVTCASASSSDCAAAIFEGSHRISGDMTELIFYLKKHLCFEEAGVEGCSAF